MNHWCPAEGHWGRVSELLMKRLVSFSCVITETIWQVSFLHAEETSCSCFMIEPKAYENNSVVQKDQHTTRKTND